jgi:ferredoxin-nitrate reductase
MVGSTAGFSEIVARIESAVELTTPARDLLMHGPAQKKIEGKLICSCCQVGEDTICDAARSPGADLPSVCRSTGAGTACGSCRPEIATLIKRVSSANSPKSAIVSLQTSR